jgi:uncharacterized membrane protein (DUF485 family)
MKGSSTLFLRALLFILGALVFGFFALVIPDEARFEDLGILLPFVVAMYFSTIPFFFALYQTFKLLNYIDENKAFSELSVKALSKIKYSAIVFAVIYGVFAPFMFYIAQLEDAPGVGAIAIILTGTPLGIATFIAVLQRILGDALKLKSENDLTV